MKPARSLFVKIILWYFLSLLLLASILFGIFNLNFQINPNNTFLGRIQDQAARVAPIILHELYDSNYYEWGTILKRFSDSYQVDFILVRTDKQVMAGTNRNIPDQVFRSIQEEIPNQKAGKHSFRLGKKPPLKNRYLPLPPPEVLQFKYLTHTSNPTVYWAYVIFPFQQNEKGEVAFAVLLGASDSITGNGLFFNPTPWIIMIALILFISVLLWIPLIRNITKPIGEITKTTENIARGQFNIQVDETRNDEIGRLGTSINHMATQLNHYIKGQKRFLGDIAHELSSPLVRMELGLSILEQHIDDKNRERISGITDEVRHMSELVNELLSFTRAELTPEKIVLEVLPLAPLIRDVIARESTEEITINLKIDESIQALTSENLLRRALSNIIRNAIRYAGKEGAITLKTAISEETITLICEDNGPGIPEADIPHIFEPFYRPEQSRNQETGGVGLGLAIVKTCVLAMGGHVFIKNRPSRGLSLSIELQRGPS